MYLKIFRIYLKDTQCKILMLTKEILQSQGQK